ncbi:putative developmental regulator protein [Rosellinia necatrix]|uniref:Putative developmental regulator protein n=1 Tax=Rosellinia necatrix TaxID=77044 RepID=A0A1W2TAR2_ROSNE|nr:putative developmental regulator protein [Rosellinia necatrix]
MPTYLCHGFRWHRKTVRFYIAKHDIEDGATEWIVAPRSEAAIIEHFYNIYNFLPPVNPPSRNTPSPAYRKHQHAPSNDSSYVSRTSSSEYHGSEDLRYSNGNGTKTRSRSASRKSSKSLTRPRTSGRDETATNSIPFPPLPLLSPSSIATKASDYFDKSSPIKLLEEFDPKDESMASAPWAYVADHVVRVGTSVSIADEMFRYEARMKRDPNRAMHGPSDEYGRKVFGASSKKAGWLEKLRDQLQRGESIRWYVVVCGDEERSDPVGCEEEGELLEEEEEEYEEEECEGSSARSQDRAWLRQSQSTQSTEGTTTTNPSVFEGGFEYRLPELAGLAMRTPTATPERMKSKLSAPPLPQKEIQLVQSPPPPPPKSPLPPEVVNRVTRESPLRPRSARSTIGLRRLFSRRKSETSV